VNISKKDRDRLRELAKKQIEYANSPVMQSRINEWYEHNDLSGQRPMIQIETETFSHEIIPQMLFCESKKAREIEAQLLMNYVNYELFDDDYPVSPFFHLEWDIWFSLFNTQVKTVHAKDRSGNEMIAYRFEHVIKDLECDLSLLEETNYGVDKSGTLARKSMLEELFGDILPVHIVSSSPVACITYEVVKLMGMERMMFALCECPDAFHELIDRVTNDFLVFFKWEEREELLLPTNGYNKVHWGTWGFTRELPSQSPCLLNQTWGYMNSQESVCISPDMYGEFIFPYYKKIADLFGLFSYGCCEPVDPCWEKYLSKLGNLRKISISPWCNEEYMAEQLRGRKIIYHRKPNPGFISTNETFNEDKFTDHIAFTLRAAKGCKLEFTLRDIYTINNDINRARRAILIIREQIDKLW